MILGTEMVDALIYGLGLGWIAAAVWTDPLRRRKDDDDAN